MSDRQDNVTLQKNIINFLILAVYFILNLWISSYHEAWRDESQAWVLVRNSTIPEIFGLCASEGHPCLWFLFLYPFTRLGFSFYDFSYISLIIMTFAAALWLWKAPFGLFTRICVLLSPLFFYYNPVICRIYSLLMVIVLLLCIQWKDRHTHPVRYGILVALLIQSHILVIGMAIGCILDMLLELKDNKASRKPPAFTGLIISVSSFILLLLELKQDNNTEAFLNVNPSSVLNNVRPTHVYEVLLSFSSKFGKITGWVILLLSLLFLLYLFTRYIKDTGFRREYSREFIVMLCAISVYAGVMFLVRSADHIQIAIIFWIFLMFICWAGMLKDDLRNMHLIITVFLTGICILDMPTCLYSDIRYEINGLYSGGEEITSLIKDNLPEGSTIVLRNDLFSPSVYAYLAETDAYNIWDIENISPYSIHKWGKVKPRELTDSEVPVYIREDFKPGDEVYFVAASHLSEDENVKLLFSNSSPSKWHEDFCVYSVIVP